MRSGHSAKVKNGTVGVEQNYWDLAASQRVTTQEIADQTRKTSKSKKKEPTMHIVEAEEEEYVEEDYQNA